MSTATRLHELAGPLLGVVRLEDLVGAGFSDKAIRILRADGWLVPIRKGTYAVGGREPTDKQRLVAAYRSAGPTAVVSHSSAARLHQLPIASKQSRPELTMLDGHDPRIGGVRIHVSQLPPSHTEVKGGLRTTTPGRTLVDLAPTLGRPALEKLVDEGLITHHWTIDSVVDVLGSVPRREGLVDLREVVAVRGAPGSKVDSALELRVVRALAAYAPFETQYQVVIRNSIFVVDMAWPPLMVAVEAEGWDTRSKSRSKFDHERRKFNLLVSNGWQVLHMTSSMTDDEMRAAVFPVLVEAATAKAGRR